MQKQVPWALAIFVILLLATLLVHRGFDLSAAALAEESEESPGILLGAHIPPVDPSLGPNRLYYWQEIETFNQIVGRRHPIIMYFSDLTSGLGGYLFDQLRDKIDPSPVPYVQMDPLPNIEPSDLIHGFYDAQLLASAAGVKSFGKPVIIGFAHEFNLSKSIFYGDPAAYIAAFRYVHNLFDQAGATNAQWLWPPNYKSDRPYDSISDYTLYYPGDAYVDWIAVYGFNWGSDLTRGPGWVEYDYLFDDFLRNTACRYDRPLMVGPTGSVEGPGSKTAWIANIYGAMRNYPNVRAIVWFNDFAYADPSEADFRVTVTSKYGAVPGPLPYYTAAYKTAMSSSSYLTEFPGYAEIKPEARSCFTIDTLPSGTLLEWGSHRTAKVLVNRAPIFSTSVNIRVTGTPSGLQVTVNPSTLGPDTTYSTIELYAADGTPTGAYTLNITAEADGLSESRTMYVLVVEEALRHYLPLLGKGPAR
mgnify:CR=1 FL=1